MGSKKIRFQLPVRRVRLTPYEGIAEEEATLQAASRKDARCCCLYLSQFLFGWHHGCGDFLEATNTSHSLARKKTGRSMKCIPAAFHTIQANDSEHSPGSQQFTKTHKSWPQGKMVQRSNTAQECETFIRKRIAHDVARHEVQIRSPWFCCGCNGDDAGVKVNARNVLALLRQSVSEQAFPTTHVKCIFA